MVREGFPPISRPLPALLQGPEYDDIPVESKPKDVSTFEKPSLSYRLASQSVDKHNLSKMGRKSAGRC